MPGDSHVVGRKGEGLEVSSTLGYEEPGIEPATFRLPGDCRSSSGLGTQGLFRLMSGVVRCLRKTATTTAQRRKQAPIYVFL